MAKRSKAPKPPKEKTYTTEQVATIIGTERGFVAHTRAAIRREAGEDNIAKKRCTFDDLVQLIIARDLINAGIAVKIAASALVATRGIETRVTIPIRRDERHPLAVPMKPTCGIMIDYPAAIAQAKLLLLEMGGADWLPPEHADPVDIGPVTDVTPTPVTIN